MSETAKVVLVVEASPKDRQIYSETLRELNYHVLTAEETKPALEMLKVDRVDLVVASADGQARGLEILKLLRKAKETRSLPILVLSKDLATEKEFQKLHSTDHEAFLKVPSPVEEVVDFVETAIGLPTPPNGSSSSNGSSSGDSGLLRNEIEALQEQVFFYQKQLEQVSYTGEKENQEMDQVLGDLQNDLEKERSEKQKVAEEIRMLKSELAERDTIVQRKDKEIGDLQEKLDREKEGLNDELQSLRATFEESQEKHKKAQNALREYYKPKVSKIKSLQKTIVGLEAKIDELTRALKAAESSQSELKVRLDQFQPKLDQLEKEKAELEEELKVEQRRSKKAQEKLDMLKKALD